MLSSKLGNSYDIKVYSSKNTIKNSGKLATGDTLKLYSNGKLVHQYKISIKGDVTGSGNITISDVAKLYQYLKGKITLDECYKEAGNVVSSDSNIKINDVAKLYQYVKGKINNLE